MNRCSTVVSMATPVRGMRLDDEVWAEVLKLRAVYGTDNAAMRSLLVRGANDLMAVERTVTATGEPVVLRTEVVAAPVNYEGRIKERIKVKKW